MVGLNLLYVAAGYAQLEVFPVFAKNESGISERQIGLIFFANTLAIVVAQLPFVKVLEGRRRMPALALMTLLWAVAWMIVFGGGLWAEGVSAALVFGIAFVIFGLGECMHGLTQGALVADLAPPRLRGRYMALSTLSWEVGFVIGPATAVSSSTGVRSPSGRWPRWCVRRGAGALLLERKPPPALRLTPS